MGKIFKALILSLTLSIFANGSQITAEPSYKDAILKGQKENKKVVMFVYSDYCPWCKKMERTTLRNRDVVKYMNEKYIFVEVNQDRDVFPPRFLPYGVPTTYVIDPNSESKVLTMRGYKSAGSFLSRLKY